MGGGFCSHVAWFGVIGSTSFIMDDPWYTVVVDGLLKRLVLIV